LGTAIHGFELGDKLAARRAQQQAQASRADEFEQELQQRAQDAAAQRQIQQQQLAITGQKAAEDARLNAAQFDAQQNIQREIQAIGGPPTAAQIAGIYSRYPGGVPSGGMTAMFNALQPSDATKPSNDEAKLANYQKSQDALDAASQAFQAVPDTDPRKAQLQAAVQKAEQQFNYWDRLVKGQQTNISVTSPSGEQTQVTTGLPQTMGVTGNVQSGLVNKGLGTKVGIQEAKYSNAMELVKNLEDSLEGGDVGILGNLKELYARTAGQLTSSPDVFKKTLGVRNTIAQLRAFAREIPEGGRETEAARKEVLESLPENGIWSSASTAAAALAATRRLIASRARGYGEEVGRMPLVSMSKEELVKDFQAVKSDIKNRVQAGLIDPQTGVKLINKSWQEHMDARTRYLPND